MSGARKLFQAARRRLRDAYHGFSASPELPRQRRVDDLFLVEFPKSGVTWLSFLFANTNLLLSGKDERRATFFNINDFVPDIAVDRDIGLPLLPIPGHRVIKSHAVFNLAQKKVVYLVRDPLKVMVSYHKFLTGLGWAHGSLAETIEHPRFGIGAWRDHVGGWLDSVPPYHFFTLVRYEDLIADTAAELKQLYRLQGFTLDDALAAKAVERSSIESMRMEEDLFNRSHPRLQGFSFVRKADQPTAEAKMTDAIRQRIVDVAGPLMKRLGYK